MDEPTGPTAGPEQPTPAPPPSPSYAPPPAYAYAAPPAPRRHRVWPWVLLGGGLFLGFCAVAVVLVVFTVNGLTGSGGGFDSIGSSWPLNDLWNYQLKQMWLSC